MSDSLSSAERYALLQTLNALPPPTFEALRYAVGAPRSVLPNETAPQGSRGIAFLEWAESPVGKGLVEVQNTLDLILNPEPPQSASTLPPKTSPTPQITTKTGDAPLLQEDLGGGITLDLVLVPKGSFYMGEPERRGYHKVDVPAFYMSKYPVTQEQWKIASTFDQLKRVMDQFPSHLKRNTLPVTDVSWRDAVEFCQRLSIHTGKSYRLPSEAEWEYACRAGTETPYSFGESISRKQINCNKWCGQTEVGRFPSNAFGLYDMHGNVWEWCEDFFHSSYAKAPSDGSARKDRNLWGSRVIRGGSWYDPPKTCRSAYRSYNLPGDRNILVGFRVVCIAP